MNAPLFGGCRLHGPSCRIPWGYDEAHSDQRAPYTLDQLATRQVGPHRYAYPGYEEYVAGWRLWVALDRDARLNSAERRVVLDLRMERVAAWLGERNEESR